MFKFFSLVVFSFSIASAASSLPMSIDDLTFPCVVAERPGIYKFTLSTDIATRILDELRSLPKDTAENHKRKSPAEEFQELLRHFIYPHPSTINGVKTLWRGFSSSLRCMREIFCVGESLPFFSLSKYEKSSSLDEAILLFQHHIESSLAALPAQPHPDLVRSILSHQLPKIRNQAQELLNQYNDFYFSRSNPFRTFDIERFVLTLLKANSNTPIAEKSLAVLDILQRDGCLTLASPITESVFAYSPRAMVEAYIAQNGEPTTIVLGCGHSNSRDMLEMLGLEAETWCGACDKLPHAGAMVVSLHEPTADILCDLNHPDLWASLRNGSATAIYDETWCLHCYTTATLDQIARVLKVGGELYSIAYNERLPFKTKMMTLGFAVVKEDVEKHLLMLRKIR